MTADGEFVSNLKVEIAEEIPQVFHSVLSGLISFEVFQPNLKKTPILR